MSLFRIFTVALFYALFGELGRRLAIPPGFATIVWPSAGVALSALLIWGNSCALGVFLGSTFINVLISTKNLATLPGEFEIILAASIGLGASLQALLSSLVIKKILNRNYQLIRAKDISYFLILGGPIACTISATIGVSSLYFAGIVNGDSLFSSWITWWIGDTLGVLAFAPLMLCLFDYRDPIWLKRRVTLLIPLTLTFMVIVLFFKQSLIWEQQRANLLFQQRASILSDRISDHFLEYSRNLEIFESYIEIHNSWNSKEFKQIADKFLDFNQGISALSWNPYIGQEEKTKFENEMIKQGYPNFKIFDLIENETKLASVGEKYVVIKYIEPYETNKNAIGLNIYSNPTRQEAIIKAIETKTAIATSKIQLVQSKTDENGLLLLHPVFKKNPQANKPEKLAVLGFLAGVFKIDNVINDLIKTKQNSDLEVMIRDESAIGDSSRFYESHPDSFPEDFETSTNANFRYVKPWLDSFEFGGRKYTIFIQNSLDSLHKDQSWTLWSSIVGGLILIALLDVFLLILTGRNEIVEAAIIEKERIEKYLEILVAQRTKQLEVAKNSAIKSERIKSEFLANMSHEIRTPLNGILGLSSLLLEKTLEDETSKMVGTISSCADNLMAVVNDILDFSKLESGKFEITATVFSLRAEIIKCINLYQGKAKQRQIELELDWKKSDLDMIKGDPNRIFQIISNLLSNAIKFSSNSTVKFTLESKVTFDNAQELTLSVEDHGIGIPLEAQANIFQAFTQGDSSISRRFGGTGLGLSISKRLAELMGGDLNFTSRADVGSVFTLKIPVEKVSARQMKKRPKHSGQDLSHLQIKILLVEDNLVNQDLIIRYLKKLGLSTDIANNGQEAIEKNDKERYDLILMDMQMPIMGGVEATRIIRKKFDSNQLKIVALTANVLAEQKKECIDAGMDGFIGKPLTRNDIAEIISQLFISEPSQTKNSA